MGDEGRRAPGSAWPSGGLTMPGAGWTTIVGTSDVTFKRIFEAMGRADLLQDPRYTTTASRLQHGEEVDALVATWCRSLPLAALQVQLTEMQVPHSKVYTIADTVADPQFRARGAVVQLPDPELGSIAAPCIVPQSVRHSL